ncbi:MAG: heavy metal translocating P-type ATPase [Leptolyngbya sp. PLA1]|nr:heavy metal translocating P-type ATPase [Leptolyngbya sp. PLA1]
MSHEPAHVCLHCGLPSPPPASDAPGAFCCNGCAAAYSLIHSNGLDRFYELCNPGDACTPRAAGSRSFDEFDDPAFLARHTQALAGGHRRAELLLAGIHCGACVWLLERLPRVIPGLISARVSLHRATISLVWNATQAPLSRIARTLDSLGYPPAPLRTRPAALAAANRKDLIHLGVAGACAGNAMLYAVCLYAGIFEGIESENAALFRWLSLAVTGVSLAWPGRVFFANAIAAIRTRTPHLDLPITLALVAGVVWSVVSTVRGEGEVYFDSLSVLVFALLAGRYLQRRRQQAGASAVELLFSLTSPSARRLDPEGRVTTVPADALKAEDLLEIRAGDSFPADGVVTRGDSTADLSLLSGESRPVRVTGGDQVYAGATNLGSSLLIRVTRAGDDTRVASLMRLVEDAAQRRAPIVQMADRLSGAFVIGMLSLGVLTYIAYSFAAPHLALERAVALLIVTCPCALGLATPLTLVVALGRAARQGILVKGGDAIEKLSRPGDLFLDKTGTITFGSPRVLEWKGDESIRTRVAALELHAAHPLAAALRDGLEHEARPLAVTDVRHSVGAGISGTVEGHSLVIGSPEFIRGCVPDADPALLATAADWAARGLTPVAIAQDGRLAAVASLDDRVRPDAARAISQLRAMGFRPRILSGDHPAVVASVAAQVGIEPEHARGGLLPEDKLAIVADAARRGPVVFVGDGVNDAAALAAAPVGIAVHSGAEAALAAADIYISRPGLAPLVSLARGSRDAISTIKRNLWLSFIYNVVAIIGTVGGLVTPLLAALIMPLSSITVLTVALRSRAFAAARGRPQPEPGQIPANPTEAPAWA